MQRALQPLDDRNRLLEQEAQSGQLVGVERVVPQGVPGIFAGDLLVEQRTGRRQQADGDTGQRRVDARLQQGEPHADAEDGVDHQGPDPQHASHDHGRQQGDRDREPAEGQVGGVEDRDHQDRADVVDDRERQQEQACRRGDAATQHAEDADGEGDVGRHRDPPARGPVTAGRVEGHVERGRHHHAADRRHDRQRGGPGVAQVAVDQLVLDLEPDHEEEDHHQGVVDPVLQGLVEMQRPGVQHRRGCARTRRRSRPRRLLAQISAVAAARSSRSEPAASTRRNSRTGRATRRASGLLLAM